MNQKMNSLEQAIVSKDFSKVPVEVLEHYHLAAYSHIHDPASRNAKTKEAFLQFHMRHQVIKKQLIPLFQAWHEAGIDVMVYKGFYLAEYIYTQPAERFYGDVDIIIKPENTREAQQIAISLGWMCGQMHLTKHNHQAFYGEAAQGSIRFEVHHQTIPMAYSLRQHWRQHFSDMIWCQAKMVNFGNAKVYIPEEIDALLLSMLDRYYQSDEFLCHKMHDFSDMEALMGKNDFMEKDVLKRAKDLNCAPTIKLFLTRCNIWRRYLKLNAPKPMKWQRSLTLTLFHKRSTYPELLLSKIMKIQLLWLFLPEVRGILLSLYQLQRYSELPKLFQKNTPAQKYTNPALLEEKTLATIRGIKWAAAILRPLIKLQGSGLCLVRSLTLYRRLLAKGYEVRFISGVRRDETGTLKGHAWVEYQGQPLPMLGDERSPFMFKESWCSPPRNESPSQNIHEAA